MIRDPKAETARSQTLSRLIFALYNALFPSCDIYIFVSLQRIDNNEDAHFCLGGRESQGAGKRIKHTSLLLWAN